ncbi:hypothetical protein BC941DRAFT_459003 [Chlamydoabsidia padenii]|nr:hypothetical protein BC941DRAFT_459003 [Chlamydoabsidia padenii]
MFRRDEKKSLDNGSLESQEVRPFTREQVIICTTHGKIYAIHKKDGISVFVTDNDKVLVGGIGRTACLDLFTGTTKMINSMKVTRKKRGAKKQTKSSTPSRFLLPKAYESNDPGAPPSYETTTAVTEKQVFIGCSSGKVIAMDPETGEKVWKYNCPQSGYSIPAVLIEPPSQNSEWSFQVVYIGCGKMVYCLCAESGQVLWVVKISNSKSGLDYMSLATPWSSRLSAEANTNFSNTPHAQKRESTTSTVNVLTAATSGS